MGLFMDKPKQSLNIELLKTIDDILSELNFLKYNTRTRNLAYQLQLLNFLNELVKSYDIYGGIRKCLIRQLVSPLNGSCAVTMHDSLGQRSKYNEGSGRT
jgi:hypothetical protein